MNPMNRNEKRSIDLVTADLLFILFIREIDQFYLYHSQKRLSMVRLLYAFVGEAGCVYRVNIRTSQSFNDLKCKIKEENPLQVTCNAADLRLFLAKRGNAWVTAHRGVNDTSDLMPLYVVNAPLSFFGLSGRAMRTNVTTEDANDRSTHMHVLVVVPSDPTLLRLKRA
ncbi:hypothetical protein KXD40_004802 [Peronospora effusa]|uniref:Crinkler effector protein N-terminal domain-containing protein n=1 Tax=Peronospora effusa TaxID=542832 RepID=A0A3M6VN88_9STRA|nr:hypothetical protein DD238_008388 [Peronospora effusa]RQM11708.1 hypothetical protein DD237_008473 [Peronospora effusa]UIZ22618.1 hypothetical protein KXD40_004802 [Peronospora effusa]